MSFSTLGLSDEILRAVAERGYTQPTPIQVQAIPAILRGDDLLAGAQTGTGKTAGFVLPILQHLSESDISRKNLPSRRPIRVLILTPTRELAAQVEESVRDYGKYLSLNSMTLFGGVNINPQIQRLKSRVDIVVATPGRLLDHVQQRTIDLSRIEVLVLDEADRMLDMGFIRDIRRIIGLLPQQRQSLLFSATFSDEIKALAQGMLNQPVLIEVARRNATAELVAQKVYQVAREKKSDLLSHLITQERWFQVLVFTRTKHGADRLSKKLAQDGIPAMAIHGNKSQMVRTRTLAKFKDGSLQVLVATDIAARGIDINELPHVVNFDLPFVPEDYVHRIGRTGRAGSEGEAVSLVCVDEHKLLADIEKVIKRSLPQEVVAGFEPDPNAKPEPIQNGRGQASRDQGSRGQGGRGQSSRPAKPVQSSQPKADAEGGKRARPVAQRSSSTGQNRRQPQRSN